MTQPTHAEAREAAWPPLTKGHGTGNDFLLFTDPSADLELDAAIVAALTDRHTGIGADGLIRVARSDALAELHQDVAAVLADSSGRAEWFMDYRNADGSIAEMCGNGVRVFVRYLQAQGLIDLPEGATVNVGTRAGVLPVRREGDRLAVAMGAFEIPGGEDAAITGWDAEVAVMGLEAPRPGLRVAMPNPHVVVAVATDDELANLDLGSAPTVQPTPAHGINVEIVHALGEDVRDGVETGLLAMRVHERGVGETLSCGTGACAAAVAASIWRGAGAPNRWCVRVPGGEVEVRLGADRQVELIGPAELVASITVL